MEAGATASPAGEEHSCVPAALVLLAPLVLAGLAGAADDTFVGTYQGWGEGTGKGGGKATSAVTVWVQDLGDQVRFTIRAARIGVTFDAQGPKQWQDGRLMLRRSPIVPAVWFLAVALARASTPMPAGNAEAATA